MAKKQDPKHMGPESSEPSRRRFLKSAVATASAVGAAATPLAALARDEDPRASTEPAGIPTRPFGNTGKRVPILHLGTAQRLDPRYDKLMHRSFAAGVTWFDTALAYGRGASHRAIANFLTQIEDRKALWLTSKSGAPSVPGLRAGVDQALDELGTDYLDLYLMHGVDDPRMLERQYLTLGDELKASGKTRFFGFSCHDGNVVALLNKAAESGGIDAILFRYNFRRYGDLALNRAIDACHRKGIALLAMKTQGSVPKEIESVVEFRSQSFTLGQAKLKSVWADERITSIVSEMDSVALVRENVAAARSETSLTAEESHQLNQLAAFTAAYSCNGCKHLCENAVPGPLAIAAPLRYLMYHECYGKSERARELYRELPAAARAFSDRDLERDLAQASRVCPQGIDIPARLRRAREVLA
jgi:predicted aldo/keto reductase-like oxidoreductase